MRMLMRVQIDTQAGSAAIKDGSLPKAIEMMVDQLKPEAAYFATSDGVRTAYIVFDLAETAQIPVIAEPFFMNLNAKIDLQPVMSVDDVLAGATAAAKMV